MNENKENQTADHIPEASPVLWARNSVVRDSHRQSRSTFVAHPGCGYDGFGPDIEGTKPELRRRRRTAEMMRWRKTMGSPTTLLERIVQQTWLLVPYIAVVVTAILVLEIVYHA